MSQPLQLHRDFYDLLMPYTLISIFSKKVQKALGITQMVILW